MTRFVRAGLLAIASGLLLGAGCPSLDPFACQGDDQCTLAADGVCHLDRGACSYPDDACESGRRYSETAGALARTCVEEEPAESSSSGEPPLPVCGNAVIEGDEECDEGEDVPCDACLPDCRLAAVVRWSATHDEHGSGDFFDSAAVDPGSGDVVAVGRTFPGPVGESADKDRLVVRYDAEGSRRWAVAAPRPGRDDLNCVVFGPSGELIAAGVRISDDDREELWVGRYDESGATELLAYGELEMQATHGDDCVFTTDGRLVVSGRIDGPDMVTTFEKWDRLVLDDALGTPTRLMVQDIEPPLDGTRDIAYRAAAGPGGSVLVGGNITINTRDASERWLAHFDASGLFLDDYVDGGPGMGQEEIFGLAVSDGVVFAAGSEVFGDGGTEQAWVARFTLEGLQRGWQSNLGLEPPATASDIALDANGDLLVVAELEGVGTALTKLDPEGSCEWLVSDPGGAMRLSGITMAPDGSAILTGATTLEDEAGTDALVVSLRL